MVLKKRNENETFHNLAPVHKGEKRNSNTFKSEPSTPKSFSKNLKSKKSLTSLKKSPKKLSSSLLKSQTEVNSLTKLKSPTDTTNIVSPINKHVGLPKIVNSMIEREGKKDSIGLSVVNVNQGAKLKKIRKRANKRHRRGKKTQTNPVINQSSLLDIGKLSTAVEALLQLSALKSTTNLLQDEEQPIHLQVTAVHVPSMPSDRFRFALPHPIVTESTDVCLFIHNMNKRSKDPEITLQYFQDRMDAQNVTGITKLITLREMKTEYSQYEQQRRLCNRFDVFLCDARISNRVIRHFGKHMNNTKKAPIPIHAHSTNLKQEIEKALTKTTLTVHSKGDSYCVVAGHTHQSPKDVAENINTIVAGLFKVFPGGWDNVRALYIKTNKSMPVPVYVSLKSPNEVAVPKVQPKRPKLAQPVEDDLSTVMGTRVIVYPSGNIVMKKASIDNDIEWTDEESEKIISRIKGTKKWGKKNKVVVKKGGKVKKETGGRLKVNKPSNDVDAEDDIGSDAEDAYLMEWSSRWQGDDLEEKEPIEDTKKVKKEHEIESTKKGKTFKRISKLPKNTGDTVIQTAVQELKSVLEEKKQKKRAKMDKLKVIREKKQKVILQKNQKGKAKGKK
uniref:Ribosomal protein L1 n=1 Tax=Timema bartmani TaxID=61472 RepID=A0A7R9EU71_9NEOP|nr:unnamed protein product [Timema bartmani]